MFKYAKSYLANFRGVASTNEEYGRMGGKREKRLEEEQSKQSRRVDESKSKLIFLKTSNPST